LAGAGDSPHADRPRVIVPKTTNRVNLFNIEVLLGECTYYCLVLLVQKDKCMRLRLPLFGSGLYIIKNWHGQ